MTLMKAKPTLEKCPVCGGRFARLRHQWLFVCSNCGLLSSNLEPEIPTEAGQSIINETRRSDGLRAIRTRNNSRILDSIGGALNGGRRRLLDVGSGLGFFLKNASARGFQVTGIEPDANVVNAARKSGLDVRHGYFPDCMEPGEQFDVIVFNDVFEHIPNIDAAMRACVTHLSPRGVLVLNCPNKNGVFYRISEILDRIGCHGAFDRVWQRNLPSPHVWYFTPSQLARLGRQHGLEAVSIIKLTPITLRGISNRIFHVGEQSKIIGVAAVIATTLIAPFLSILPRDIGVVLLRKNN
jgi:SAM-dependent methyltransferase